MLVCCSLSLALCIHFASSPICPGHAGVEVVSISLEERLCGGLRVEYHMNEIELDWYYYRHSTYHGPSSYASIWNLRIAKFERLRRDTDDPSCGVVRRPGVYSGCQ